MTAQSSSNSVLIEIVSKMLYDLVASVFEARRNCTGVSTCRKHKMITEGTEEKNITEIELSCGKVTRMEPGIVRTQIRPGHEMTGQDALALREAVLRIGGPRPRLLIDHRISHSVSLEGKSAFVRETIFKAVAFVILEGVNRKVAEYTSTSPARTFPVQYFITEAEALAWLREQG
jgi:hypothetical protein